MLPRQCLWAGLSIGGHLFKVVAAVGQGQQGCLAHKADDMCACMEVCNTHHPHQIILVILKTASHDCFDWSGLISANAANTYVRGALPGGVVGGVPVVWFAVTMGGLVQSNMMAHEDPKQGESTVKV